MITDTRPPDVHRRPVKSSHRSPAISIGRRPTKKLSATINWAMDLIDECGDDVLRFFESVVCFRFGGRTLPRMRTSCHGLDSSLRSFMACVKIPLARLRNVVQRLPSLRLRQSEQECRPDVCPVILERHLPEVSFEVLIPDLPVARDGARLRFSSTNGRYRCSQKSVTFMSASFAWETLTVRMNSSPLELDAFAGPGEILVVFAAEGSATFGLASSDHRQSQSCSIGHGMRPALTRRCIPFDACPLSLPAETAGFRTAFVQRICMIRKYRL
jgi:hypothetical protein